MYYTIYKTTNLLNGKIYVGKHQTKNPNDSYLGSGVYLQKAIRKYGKENFSKEVLFVFDNEIDMLNKEIELVNEDYYNSDQNYNGGPGGQGGALFKNKKHSTKSKLKIATSNTGKKYVKTVEHIQKNKDARYKNNNGKYASKETCEKISIKAKERYANNEIKHFDKVKKKISKSLKEYFKTHEANNKGLKYSLRPKTEAEKLELSRIMKEKHSKKYKDTIWIKNVEICSCIRIPKSELNIFQSKGYVKGRIFKNK